MPEYSPAEINGFKQRMNALKPWYHNIDLGGGLVTPGRDYEGLWNNIRSVINNIDYKDANVLDVGSWDGMWAFEAEKRGAKSVVASDTRSQGAENLLFCKYVLDSKVFPLFNAPVQELKSRLTMTGLKTDFDIVQHLGLLYHLRDPMLSLAQARAVMKEGAYLIIETAGINDDKRSFMAFNGVAPDFHFYGPSDTWAPTTLCLKEMLLRTALEPVMEDKWGVWRHGEGAAFANLDFEVSRLCVVARAVSYDTLHNVDRVKLDGSQ